MNIFFDLNHILNGSYPVDQDILAILRTECKKKPDDFSNKVDLIWKYISCLYADELNTIFELSDEIFKKQLANEIFLRLYNTLSDMPGGMPSLRRSCLPSQTIHESSQFIVPSVFILCYNVCKNNSTLQSTAW